MSKAHPRRTANGKSASPLLRALSSRRPLSVHELAPMLLPPFAALDAMHRGRGSADSRGVLAEAAVFSEFLATRGHVAEILPVVHDAQRALVSLAHGTDVTTLPHASYEALKAWLSKYIEQLEHAGLQGIVSAGDALPAFFASRTVEMKHAA
jgi:hypothetical protein